jgi:SnoaL-like domain
MGMSVAQVLVGGDFTAFSELLDPAVVWVGVFPGQLCRNRDEVLATFRSYLDARTSASPEVVAERDGLIVVDPHVQPPPEWAPKLHHVFVVRRGRIVEMRDYPDRSTALEAAEA